jgi:regulator of protease activity HflC (stomatin/prohibitin superfamily)
MGECFGGLLILLLLGLFAVIVPLAAMSIRIVRQSTVGIVERLGRYKGIEKPGLVWLIPVMDKMYIVDMREQVFALRPQPVITQDNVTMNIDAVIYYQITDPYRATYQVAQLVSAVEQLALTTLRNIIGEMSLDETLASRETVNDKLQVILDEATTKWGLKVNRVELKDINPPKDIEEAMQKQMRAERTKRAAILTAEGEKEAAIRTAEGQKRSAILEAEGKKEAAVREAEGEKEAILLRANAEADRIRFIKSAEAEMIEKIYNAIHNGRPTPELIHIKYLEALEKVSNGEGNTLLLPFEASAFMGSIVSAAQGFKIPMRRHSMPRPGSRPDINPEG